VRGIEQTAALNPVIVPCKPHRQADCLPNCGAPGRHATRRLLQPRAAPKGLDMLYTIAVVLIVLWLLGLVTSYTMGGFIHALLVIAIIMIVINLVSGRRGL
jgi:hypothetical protein